MTTRHSFIQMTKMSNVRGRITYISSHAKQEHLYAVYETTERSYWTELARCSQQEFKKSGVEGKCIEARELIIALPESLYEQGMPDILLKSFTNKFKEKYGVECVAALHYNKRMTNFHIHLIFSERQLLEEPIVKTATRNLFTSKNTRFKQEDFLNEVKLFYTRMINRWVTDEKDKLTVFDRNGPYLATKKVGKNNPKAEQIEQDNKLRMDWNREVDRAVISEVPIEDILQIKREHITEPVKRSIERYGNKPEMLSHILNMAIAELVLLITKVLEAIKGIHSRQQRENVHEDKNKAQKQDNGILTADVLPPEPVMIPKAAAYPKLKKINLKGLAKLTRKGDLQRKIDEKTDYINRLKEGLSNMVRNSGFENMNEFLLTFRECRNPYTDYQRQYESWKNACRKPDTPTHKDEKLSDKLARLQRETAENQNSISRQTNDRGVR